MNPLNPTLYRCLQAAFGTVRVSNEGQQTTVSYYPDHAHREGRLKAVASSGGEEYMVCCPFCSDTRHRLYINYRWGTLDQKIHDNFLHLCYCFNEHCTDTRVKQQQLHALIFPKGKYASQVVIPAKPVHTEPPPPPPIIKLPPSTPVEQLPLDHPACRYLTRRGFNPLSFARSYGLRYCDKCLDVRPAIREPRLIIPVFDIARLPSAVLGGKGPVGTKLAGWQARLIGPPQWEDSPKYLTARGMPKSQLLYGLVRAIRTPGPVVLVEGVVDVWKVGSNGVAMFGKTISDFQCQLAVREFRGRPLVVMLDDDAQEEAQKVCAALARARRLCRDPTPVVVAKPPAPRHDPGECGAAEIAGAVARALSEAAN